MPTVRGVSDAIEQLPHGPHYQGRQFNHLNGGIERWFAPVTSAFADNPVTLGLLTACRDMFAECAGRDAVSAYHVEVHQFRIEAGLNMVGSPTPEGMHRDGVDYACALLVGRRNIQHGATRIENGSGLELETSTLTMPMDALFVDDRRVMHGVSDISRVDVLTPGVRDVLVATFRSAAGRDPS